MPTTTFDEPIFPDPFVCPNCGSTRVHLYYFVAKDTGVVFSWLNHNYVVTDSNTIVQRDVIELSCADCHHLYQPEEMPSITSIEDLYDIYILSNPQ